MQGDIDFVIPWVDGNDPVWLNEKETYEMENLNIDKSEQRYRDWDNLQYWFRGVEKYAQWVHKIYFITYGHIPSWLNLNHPKLEIVNHKEYIPEEYLPTFSSNPIELNLHRIQGLNKKFVLFNDDTFILNKINEEDFFVNGKPCDSAILNVHCYDYQDSYILAPFVDIGVINKNFNMKDVVKQNKRKWFSLKYGKYLVRNIILLKCPRFPGMLQKHLPNAFLKSTYEEVWKMEFQMLNQTCSHKFRNILDVNQWLMKEWQIAKGNFEPRKVDIGISMYARETKKVVDYILHSKNRLICINDCKMNESDFENRKNMINQAFELKFPEKSSYEK